MATKKKAAKKAAPKKKEEVTGQARHRPRFCFVPHNKASAICGGLSCWRSIGGY